MLEETLRLFYREEMSRRLRASFSGFKEVSVAYMFGSRARGDYGQESDWDFAVLLSECFRDPYRLVRLIEEIARNLGVSDEKVNLVVLNDAELELSHRVISEGLVVYESDAEKRVEFEVHILKLYMDFKPMLDEMRRSMIEAYTHGED
jgi:predicted nucleotidyltransferase